MQLQIKPRLGRSDIVSNSFCGCIANTTEELSRAPEMSVCEILHKPRMFFQQTESTISFEQLKGLTNTHRSWHVDKQMDMVNSDVKFIDFASFTISDFPDEVLTIHPDTIELHRVHGIFAFPDKVEGILSEGMLGAFQIHFISPEHSSNYIRFNSRGLGTNHSLANHFKELNIGGGNSSIGLKTEVPLPLM